MTDKQKLVDEIVKAAEKWADWYGVIPDGESEYPDRLLASAVAAKRAAEQPQPLTAGEALKIWSDLRGCFGATPQTDMHAVLYAAADRWLKVIEAQPRYDGNGGAQLGESVIIKCANGRYVAREDIRRALSRTGGGA